MKYAFNSFVLEANIPVAIQGNDSLYTFQNITNNSITVLGSNNSTDWVSLCVVNAANAKTTNSAFKFLCINSGTLLVNRAAAGSSATTALVNESGNPLPVTTYPNAKTSAIESSIIGKLYKAWATAPATAAKYSAVQIWNPTGSGVTLLVTAANCYNSSGTMKWYPLLNQVQLTGAAGFIQKTNPIGGAPNFQILTEALTARTVNDSLGSSVSSVTPNGTVLLIGNEYYTIPEGWGLRYEGETVNVGMNLITVIVESANT